MSDEDLTRPIEAVPGPVDREAATVPVGAAAAAQADPEAIRPTPAFSAADAESTGQIVLPVGLGGSARPHAAPSVPVVDPRTTALYAGVFFAELARCGVTDFVVSPGARSTALAMVALETAGEVYVDIDERSAAFFALGLAKAKGNPVGVICTSGTAPGNWLPAVLEAQASRVPLLLLSADRPPRLQGISAHQTTDQLGLFGSHVKAFYQMPVPADDGASLSHARQIAFDATVSSHGAMPGARSCDAGPVHVNFPFDEPLTPSPLSDVRAVLDAVGDARSLPPTVVAGQVLLPGDIAGLARVLKGKRTLALCGEGTANNAAEAADVVAFAEALNVPLLADPLSGLRCVDAPCVIDNYDSVFAHAGAPLPDVIVRFGRWPVSKRATLALGGCGAIHLAVDLRDARDATASSTMLVRTTPHAFARALSAVDAAAADAGFFDEWVQANESARERINAVGMMRDMDSFEGAYVDALFDLVPDQSLVFSASSMSIRVIDTFYRKSARAIDVLCNRGLSGIDGTLSSAVGAAHAYSQTTVLVGDLAFLHDCSGLALQGEMRLRSRRGAGSPPSVVVVVLNNNGGGIFDMLPQQSSEDYFERLFITPQQFDVQGLAAAFDVPYRRAVTVTSFRRAYSSLLGTPGISVIEVPVPLAGIKDRYAPFW